MTTLRGSSPRVLPVVAAVVFALAAAAPTATAVTSNSDGRPSSSVQPRVVVVNKQSDEFDWTTLIGAAGAIAGAAAGFAGSQSAARIQAKREDAARRSTDIRRLVAASADVLRALVPFSPHNEGPPSASDTSNLIEAMTKAGSIQPWVTDADLMGLSTKLLHTAAAVPGASQEKRGELRTEAAETMNELSARARQLS